MLGLRSVPQLGTFRSTYVGRQIAFQPVRLAPQSVSRVQICPVEAKRVCQLTGKKRNKANVVTFSNKHNRKWQYPNLQYKKVFWAKGQRLVKLRICTKAIKTLSRKSIDVMAKEAGIDLWKLPYVDMRASRLQYKEEHKGEVPVSKKRRPLLARVNWNAAVQKHSKYPIYEPGGRIVWVRAGTNDYERVMGVPEPTPKGAAVPAAATAKSKGPKLTVAKPQLKITLS